jgi:hypothetical protein
MAVSNNSTRSECRSTAERALHLSGQLAAVAQVAVEAATDANPPADSADSTVFDRAVWLLTLNRDLAERLHAELNTLDAQLARVLVAGG